MDISFYQEILDSLAEGVYFVDLDRKITYWNKAAERLSGYTAQEVLGNGCADNLLRHVDALGTQLCLAGCPLAATMLDGQPREAEVFMHHKFGHRVPIAVRVTPMRGKDGRIVGAVEIFSPKVNETNVVRELESLRRQILTDPLTGIANRRFAEMTLSTLESSLAMHDIPFGALFVDIDHFKVVNDTWGHHVGDQVLKMVGQTLKQGLRTLDSACRWGGEEFLLLVPNTTEPALRALAERLRLLVENSWIDREGRPLSVTASFGGAIALPGESAAQVVGRADRELYRSKEAGRNCVSVGCECVNGQRRND